MATVLPPASKRQKALASAKAAEQQGPPEAITGSVRLRFFDSATDEPVAPAVMVQLAQASNRNLNLLVNSLRGHAAAEEQVDYAFTHRSGPEIIKTEGGGVVEAATAAAAAASTELEQTLTVLSQAPYRVRGVTRHAASMPGHEQAVLCAQFAPDASGRLASGSGDMTVRLWDCDTGTSRFTFAGHSDWVLALAWAPDGALLASGSMDGSVRLWNPGSGKAVGSALLGHRRWVTSISWEPLHAQPAGQWRLASSSKDATVRLWNVTLQRADAVLAGHTASVSCVKWGGLGYIYTASQDRTLRVWHAATARPLHCIAAHAHWINHLALSTDYVLRTGYFDPDPRTAAKLPANASADARRAFALERFKRAATVGNRLVEHVLTASDDCTMALWDPVNNHKKPLARLNGHQKQVTHVAFSPDCQWIASAGWDNHVKLWSARNGAFVATLRGHVAAVYQVCFSGDSRLLVSASKDTTLKVWDVKSAKLLFDLPGHSDEVYAVDWAPDGLKVGSGGKDKVVKLWCN